MENPQCIVILDFGGQYTQLIARRVRECGVYSEVLPYSTPLAEIRDKAPLGMILSGGPSCVTDVSAPFCDIGVFSLGVPVLGICYGMQLTSIMLGGGVNACSLREYGRSQVAMDRRDKGLLRGLATQSYCWMSHTYQVSQMPAGFDVIAHTDHCPVAAMADETRRIYGVQFHPEVTHTEEGRKVLQNFLFDICGMKGDWNMAAYAELEVARIRKQVGLVFQYPEYQLFEETVAKDVAFGPKNMGLTKEEIDERVRWAIAQVGLDYAAVAASSPFELSGGQMRRVAIAGVLAMRPKTLILDEPTAGLDPRGRRAILDMIRRLHAENSMTVIMVSHNMDDIATLATRLVVMGKGELRMTGTPREVFKHRDELRAIGLGVPQGAELCHRLRALGFAIPEGLYLLPEVLDAILTLAGKAAPSGASEPVAAMLAQALAMPGPDALEGAAAPPDAGDAQPDGASPAAERGRA